MVLMWFLIMYEILKISIAASIHTHYTNIDTHFIEKGRSLPFHLIQKKSKNAMNINSIQNNQNRSHSTLQACTATDKELVINDGYILGTTNIPIKLYQVFVATSSNITEFSASTTPSITRKFAEGISGSSYGNINTYYYDNAGIRHKNLFQFGGQAFVTGCFYVIDLCRNVCMLLYQSFMYDIEFIDIFIDAFYLFMYVCNIHVRIMYAYNIYVCAVCMYECVYV